MYSKKPTLNRKQFITRFSQGVAALYAGLLYAPYSFSQSGPLSTASSPKNVLVLGAGLAGLAAARELIRNGHTVTLLEARDRPGGKVSTLREPFADGLYAEAGAVAFSEAYTLCNSYIEKYGFEKIPWAFPDAPITYYFKGEAIHAKPGEAIKWPFELTEEEQSLGPMGMMQKYLIDTLPELIKDPDNWKAEKLMHFDKKSLADYLKEQGASDGAIELFTYVHWFAAVPHDTSALAMAISDFGLFMSAMPFTLKGGNDQLPRAMAEELGEIVKYQQVVATVVTDDSGVTVTTRDGTAYTGDEVICCLPPHITAKVVFSPELSEEKLKAMASIPTMDVTRTYFQVDRPYWMDKEITGIAYTDTMAGQVFPHLNAEDATGKPALLESFNPYPEYELDKLNEADCITKVQDAVNKVHPGLKNHIQDTHLTCWATDPYSLGGPSWADPGFLSAHLVHLSRQEGKIHFAGEHTTILRSTMEGAMRSGVRAAGEVQDS